MMISGRDDADDAAALRIQGAWRRARHSTTTLRLVVANQTADATTTKCAALTFEALVVFLREKALIARTRRCLQRLHTLCVRRHGRREEVEAPTAVNVRIFLAAYLIVARPTRVFETPGGALEQRLLASATALLAHFERLCAPFLPSSSSGGHHQHQHHQAEAARHFADVPPAVSEGFASALEAYLLLFRAWKVPDDTRLTGRIRHALIALYQAAEQLPSNEPADSTLRRELCTQTERLRDKLRLIAGEEALRQFDRDRRTLAPAGQPAAVVVGGGGGGSGTAYETCPARASNEQLAHELLLDPGFQLDDATGELSTVTNPVANRIRATFHEAFWNSLTDDLQAACFARALRVLGELRDGIAEVAGGREASAIRELIDVPFIEAQTQAGAFNWDSCTRLVAGVVASVQRIQRVSRDPETRAGWARLQDAMRAAAADASARPRVFCDALRFLLDRVGALRIDAANARLRLLAPVLRVHGVVYARGKFQDKLNAGTVTLERTAACLAAAVWGAVAALKEEEGGANNNTNTNLEAQLRAGAAAAHVRIHTEMLLNLVSGEHHSLLLPETLTLDGFRINFLNAEFAYEALASRILLAADSLLFPRHPQQQQQQQPPLRAPALVTMRARLAAHLTGEDEDDPHRIRSPPELLQYLRSAEAEAALDATGEVAALAKGFVDSVERGLLLLANPNDAVARLLRTRLASVWRFVLLHGGRFPTPETAPELNLMHAPAAVFQKRILFHVARLTRMMTVDREIHAPFYDTLVGQILAKGPPAVRAAP